jgi:hypothetical protein
MIIFNRKRSVKEGKNSHPERHTDNFLEADICIAVPKQKKKKK